jgi:hypothetical protein
MTISVWHQNFGICRRFVSVDRVLMADMLEIYPGRLDATNHQDISICLPIDPAADNNTTFSIVEE